MTHPYSFDDLVNRGLLTTTAALHSRDQSSRQQKPAS